ncbi:hypothetical protein PV326_012288, partial [Microctonus aethiopoides]
LSARTDRAPSTFSCKTLYSLWWSAPNAIGDMMCSLNDNDIDEEISTLESIENNIILDGKQCQKCNSEDATIKLRSRNVYCQSCFQISVTHKFRATLGKSKIVRPNDKVLVAHSGSGKSTALLHLIKAGMHESVHKRLVFQTQVIFIDEGMINNYSIDKRQSIINEIQCQIQPLEFETFVASLAVSLDQNNFAEIEKIQNYLILDNDKNDKQLIEFFNNLTSETSKEDLLKKLRLKVIVHAAKLLGCNKIFFADDSTSLSICILTNVSLGRGAQLSWDVGFINNLYGDDLIIMRPLKDFTRDEVNYYLHMHNLKAINSKKLMTNTDSFSSIRKLTEHFLTDLDSQFNGTMSTIFRVGEKVSAVAGCSVDQNEHCILCDAPLDTSNLGDITSAIKATAFSKLISSGQTKNSGVNGINNCSDNSSENLVEPSNTDNSCGNCAENFGKATTCKDALRRWEEDNGVEASSATEVNLSFQWPPIERMDNSLSILSKCEKLSLSTNMIEKIAGVSSLKNLKILSVGRNVIKSLTGLESLGECLEELWISYNSIEKMKGINVLKKLKVLHISNNLVKEWNEFMRLQEMMDLRELLFVGNPLCDNIEVSSLF